MNLIPQKHMKCLPPVLMIAVLALSIGILQQSRRYLRAQDEYFATNRKRIALMEKQKVTASSERIFNDSLTKLTNYDKNIPQADGFVWVSTVLQDAAPNLMLNIDPPEVGTQKVLTNEEYCTGIFQIKSTGHMGDLITLLTKLERDAPFARVQELHLTFSKPPKDEVEFSFSLLVVMRLNEELEKPLQTASSGGGK